MPHKRNPILNERISGLARVIRGYAVPALENVVLWHERDISNSSVERVILPDASTLVDYMLGLLTGIVRDMRVRGDRMEANVQATGGLFFSEKVLLALIERGLTRPEAYSLVQRSALRSWETGAPLRQLLGEDPEVSAQLSSSDLDRIFDLRGFLHSIDVAFQRLGLTDSPEAAHSDDAVAQSSSSVSG
jgi:adenylosuccinate lyase